MKVSQTLCKTIEAATAAALDTAYLAFVRTLTEEQLHSVHFSSTHISGTFTYSVLIIYTI